MDREFKTSISKLTKKGPKVRNIDLQTLYELPVQDVFFLTLFGKKPTKTQSEIFKRIIITLSDNGVGTTSTLVTRIVASTQTSLTSSVSAGILSMGQTHSGAIKKTMLFLKKYENTDIDEIFENEKTIPGLGHRLYKQNDPRVLLLKNYFKEINYENKYIKKLEEVESYLFKKKDKKIPLNIDGLIACVLLDWNVHEDIATGIFVLSRVPSLIAHFFEEKSQKNYSRRLKENIE